MAAGAPIAAAPGLAGENPRRTLGFEWQVSQFKLRDAAGELLPSKALVLHDAASGISLESDSGETEFISDPIDESGTIFRPGAAAGAAASVPPGPLQALRGQLAAVQKLLDDVNHHDAKRPFRPGVFLTGTAGSQAAVTAPAHTIMGSPQVTVGLPLEAVPAFLAGGWVGEARLVADLAAHFGVGAPLGPATYAELGVRERQVLGLLALSEMYLAILDTYEPTNAGDGPKEALSLMVRTDFRTLYGLLDGAQQAEFDRHMATVRGATRDDPVMSHGYQVEGDIVAAAWGPRVGEWLDSLANPAGARATWAARVAAVIAADPTVLDKGPYSVAGLESLVSDTKDLLSPPPFFAKHGSVAFSYAMGREGLGAGDLVLMELRDFRKAATTTPMSKPTFRSFCDNLLAFAESVFGNDAADGSKSSGRRLRSQSSGSTRVQDASKKARKK